MAGEFAVREIFDTTPSTDVLKHSFEASPIVVRVDLPAVAPKVEHPTITCHLVKQLHGEDIPIPESGDRVKGWLQRPPTNRCYILEVAISMNRCAELEEIPR